VKRMARACLLAAALCAGFGLAGAAAAADKATLRVFAAASLSGAFSDIARVFERGHPGVTVQPNFAGSQQLAAQMEQGAPADVFASADDRWMAYARDRELVAGSSSVFARNRLVVIVPTTNPGRIGRLQHLARRGIKLVIGADAVPVGHYARTVLANLSRDPAFGSAFAARVLANVVSEEENVKAIVGKVQLGEADAGIAYRSDVSPALGRYVRMLEIPERANIVASYPIAVVRGASRAADAQAFVDLVLSADGQRILARWGFTPASPPSP
jgi:molybdate transport system substrate-binding protein